VCNRTVVGELVQTYSAGQIAAQTRYSDAAEKLEGVPALSASPAEVARVADVIFIAVVDADQARQVLSGPGGVLEQARPGLEIVLQSTVSLPDLQALTELCARNGVNLVDCGVTRASVKAQGGLACFVGADAEHMARIRPILEGFSKCIAHMGGPGAGMAAKIARNMLVYGAWRVGYEAALVGKAAGVDLEMLQDVIVGSIGDGALFWFTRADPPSDPAEAAQRRAVEHLLDKDLAAALELGDRYGLDLPVTTLTRQSAEAIMGLSPAT
jgi:3-hydroxyisobutyrate dehydrogenase